MFLLIMAFFALVGVSQGCSDSQENCASYALIGLCMEPTFYKACQLSCGACVCSDALKKEECVILRDSGKCLTSYTEMKRNCRATCGFCTCKDTANYDCGNKAKAGLCITDPNVVSKCPHSCKLCGDCEDNTPQCREWAEQGRCFSDRNTMLTHCAKSCRLCDCADGPGMEARCAKGSADRKCESDIIWAYIDCAASCDLCPILVSNYSSGEETNLSSQERLVVHVSLWNLTGSYLAFSNSWIM
ncbi:hypothetical protein ACHWQZ_G016906 [Mnemiopsis leidyi]